MEGARLLWDTSLLVMDQGASQDFEYFHILSSLCHQTKKLTQMQQRMARVKAIRTWFYRSGDYQIKVANYNDINRNHIN